MKQTVYQTLVYSKFISNEFVLQFPIKHGSEAVFKKDQFWDSLTVCQTGVTEFWKNIIFSVSTGRIHPEGEFSTLNSYYKNAWFSPFAPYRVYTVYPREKTVCLAINLWLRAFLSNFWISKKITYIYWCFFQNWTTQHFASCPVMLFFDRKKITYTYRWFLQNWTTQNFFAQYWTTAQNLWPVVQYGCPLMHRLLYIPQKYISHQ